MRRVLIAAAILAAACGKRSIPASPAIKAGVAQAQSGLRSTCINTQAIIALQSLGSSVAGAVSSANLATVDLATGLPDPASLAFAALVPAGSPPMDQLLADSRAAAVLAPVAGCLRTGPGGSPTLDPAGQAGCSAADHLEVTYDGGDKLNISWREASASFDLALAVVAGPWAGTSLHYSGAAGSSGASVTVAGAMKFSKAGDATRVDTDFSLTYVVTGSQSATGAIIGISVTGTATDHIALARSNQRWRLSVQTSTSGQVETCALDWNGSVSVDLLKADGMTRDHSVAFNLKLGGAGQSSGATASLTWSATGDVEYDSFVVGSLVTRTNQLQLRWTDGAEDPFDAAVLFGSFAV
jgi:hypothetical protein